MQGDDDSDEVLPRRLAETKRLAGQRIVALHFGGQHAALLTVPARDGGGRAVPAEDAATEAAPEPAAVDLDQVCYSLPEARNGTRARLNQGTTWISYPANLYPDHACWMWLLRGSQCCICAVPASQLGVLLWTWR